MVLPFSLPDWVPWWVNLVILVPALLFALAFLFMPFSVIGLKARLEGVEARLDEIQGEIRSLSLRLPEGASGLPRGAAYGTLPTSPREASQVASQVLPQGTAAYAEDDIPRPPIPPAAARDPLPYQDRGRGAARSGRERTEPRLS